jgi:hypothetical protein
MIRPRAHKPTPAMAENIAETPASGHGSIMKTTTNVIVGLHTDCVRVRVLRAGTPVAQATS